MVKWCLVVTVFQLAYTNINNAPTTHVQKLALLNSTGQIHNKYRVKPSFHYLSSRTVNSGAFLTPVNSVRQLG